MRWVDPSISLRVRQPMGSPGHEGTPTSIQFVFYAGYSMPYPYARRQKNMGSLLDSFAEENDR